MSKFDHGFIVRCSTMGVACITIGAGVWGFFQPDLKIKYIMSFVNLIIISIVLLPAEFQFQWLKEGFGFIDNLFGKGAYIFFIGSWVFCFHGFGFNGGWQTYCLIVGIIDMCIGILYIIFYFGFGNPNYGGQNLQQPLAS